MDMTVDEIAQLVGGVVKGDGHVRITGVNGIREAVPGELTFVRGLRYAAYLETTRASAVLIDKAPDPSPCVVIEVKSPDMAFAQVLLQFANELTRHPKGIHPTATVCEGVVLGDDASLDARVYVGQGTRIGAGTVLYAGVYVGENAVIGAGTVLYPNVVVREGCEIGDRCTIHAGAVIGTDGFGFAPMGGQWVKIPQIGRVILGDEVEVGSNTCIDRATFGETRIGRGTKIDNLVQIGHNVQIGEHCVLAGKVGVAGSTVIGNHVRIGAAAGINGHIDIGDGAAVAAWSGVTKSVPAGRIVSGYPAIEHEEDRKVLVARQRMPELIRRMRQLERSVEALEKELHE